MRRRVLLVPRKRTLRNVTSLDALTSAIAGARRADAQAADDDVFERLIEIPRASWTAADQPDGRVRREIDELQRRHAAGGERIVPPLTLTRLSAALNQGGFCANW